MNPKIGSYVVYGINGVCRVEEVKPMMCQDRQRDYYVLAPLQAKASKIFVPADNENLIAKIKPLLSENEARALKAAVGDEKEVWSDNPVTRKELFKSVLDSGDRQKQTLLARTLCQKRKEREAVGKKLWSFEEYALETVRKNLLEELSLVLALTKDEAEEWIIQDK